MKVDQRSTYWEGLCRGTEGLMTLRKDKKARKVEGSFLSPSHEYSLILYAKLMALKKKAQGFYSKRFCVLKSDESALRKVVGFEFKLIN